MFEELIASEGVMNAVLGGGRIFIDGWVKLMLKFVVYFFGYLGWPMGLVGFWLFC